VSTTLTLNIPTPKHGEKETSRSPEAFVGTENPGEKKIRKKKEEEVVVQKKNRRTSRDV